MFKVYCAHVAHHTHPAIEVAALSIDEARQLIVGQYPNVSILHITEA